MNQIREKWISEIRGEYVSATHKHGPFASAHEGYSIILEELEELWEQVKKKNKNMKKMRHEAVQLGAMALRFLVDLDNEEERA